MINKVRYTVRTQITRKRSEDMRKSFKTLFDAEHYAKHEQMSGFKTTIEQKITIIL